MNEHTEALALELAMGHLDDLERDEPVNLRLADEGDWVGLLEDRGVEDLHPHLALRPRAGLVSRTQVGFSRVVRVLLGASGLRLGRFSMCTRMFWRGGRLVLAAARREHERAQNHEPRRVPHGR